MAGSGRSSVACATLQVRSPSLLVLVHSGRVRRTETRLLAAERAAASRACGRRGRPWLLHPPQRCVHQQGAAVLVGGVDDLCAGEARPTRAAICSALRACGLQPCSLAACSEPNLPQGIRIMAVWTGSSKPTTQLHEVGSFAADVPWQETVLSDQLCSETLPCVPACVAKQASAL